MYSRTKVMRSPDARGRPGKRRVTGGSVRGRIAARQSAHSNVETGSAPGTVGTATGVGRARSIGSGGAWRPPAPAAESWRRTVKLSVVDNETRVARLRQEMAEQSAVFESAPAGSIVAWAVERFGTRLALACSFQETVLIDIAVKVDPRIEVVFLDTCLL